MFNHFEHYLSVPYILTPHLNIWFQIPDHVQKRLIEKYYTYDESVIREVINKKLVKSRKDLDDISEATGIPLVRVTRQSDNIKRMYVLLEETKQFQGNLVKFVETIFLLPINLCRKYASLLFLLYSKFNVSSRKTRGKLSCSSLEKSASVIMAFFLPDSKLFTSVTLSRGVGSLGCYVPDCLLDGEDRECWELVWGLCSQVENIEPDKALLANFRELRNVLTGENLDQCAARVREVLMSLEAHHAIANKLGTRIRTVIKNILVIGAHLSQSSEFRDFIEDIITKV